ncbi:MAG: hypothetical protein ACLPUO_16525 [Streptosporangiaceae bacterium]|jgi:hypothetical protein
MTASFDEISACRISRREQSWRALRRMRSGPPAAASNDHQRAAMFRAAAEQAQQLFRAAPDVGPQARPLVLLDGLRQAGQAIAAASPRLPGSGWRLAGPGISVRSSGITEPGGLEVVATSDDRGFSQRMAEALDTAFLPPGAVVTLAELWPIIPEANEELLPGLWNAAWRRPALRFTAADRRTAGWDEAIISGAPPAAFNGRGTGAVGDWLRGYPSLAGWQAGPGRERPDQPETTMTAPGGLISLTLAWPAAAGHGQPPAGSRLTGRATWYRGRWWAFPAVAGLQRPLHPLLAWWLVLAGLAALAREEPHTWARMTDADQPGSPSVAIEHLLVTAVDALPEVILDALAEHM